MMDGFILRWTRGADDPLEAVPQYYCLPVDKNRSLRISANIDDAYRFPKREYAENYQGGDVRVKAFQIVTTQQAYDDFKAALGAVKAGRKVGEHGNDETKLDEKDRNVQGQE